MEYIYIYIYIYFNLPCSKEYMKQTIFLCCWIARQAKGPAKSRQTLDCAQVETMKPYETTAGSNENINTKAIRDSCNDHTCHNQDLSQRLWTQPATPHQMHSLRLHQQVPAIPLLWEAVPHQHCRGFHEVISLG